jgi:catechol 2,3-dioxygenase-like lactoylglutathione lyase family enzyme
VIRLGRIDHVCLRVADLDEAAARWCIQLGLVERRARTDGASSPATTSRTASSSRPGRAGARPHGLRARTRPARRRRARAPRALGLASEEREGSIWLADPDGRAIQLLPHRAPAAEVDRWPQHARPSSTVHLGGPRRLGHVNCLTGDIRRERGFYTDVLGMRLSDWLGDAGVWFHIDSEHHVMALVDLGYAHFHHLAFDVVDIGKMRDLLDHVARPRPLGVVGGRHAPRDRPGTSRRTSGSPRSPARSSSTATWSGSPTTTCRGRNPDDRYSSNTWGPLPPRSYFRFDPVALEWESESWRRRGRPLAARRRWMA